MLRKHLSQYSDEDLRAEIKRHVDEQIHENKKLDYKETLSLEHRKARHEAAKDISSFANEIGGCVVYGVPEEESTLPGGTKIVVPKKPYGLKPISAFEERLEDVLVETICPRLPDLQIRRVEVEDPKNPGKVVYVVWHPESWMAPHMVQAYEDHRYYKRGVFRAVKMDEHEVRQKYAQVQNYLDRTKEFLESPDVNFYIGLSSGSITHFVCCPLMLADDRIDFSSGSMNRWLQRLNGLSLMPYRWRPSYHGVCASHESWDAGGSPERFCEIHQNGAVNYYEDTEVRPSGKYSPSPDLVENLVDMRLLLGRFSDFLRFCSELYDQIGYYEPVTVRLRIMNCSEFGFFFPGWPEFARGDPITRLAVRGNTFQVDRIIPGAKLVTDPRAAHKMVFERIAHAFGDDRLTRDLERWLGQRDP